MPMIARVLRLFALLLLLQLAAAQQPAVAQSCTLSVSALSYGPVDVTANAVIDMTASVNVACTGLPAQLVGICIEIGPGSGGATDAGSRFMANGANTLRYGLFTDAGRTTAWGSGLWPAGGGTVPGVNLVLSLGGSGSYSRAIYGRVYGGQPTALPLAYASVFSGADIRIRYGLLSFLLGCDLLTVIGTASFAVTADVPPTCRITAGNLDFGSVGVLAAARDAGSVLTPTCTNGTPYRIALDGGLSGASDPAQRRMAKGAESVIYGLYRNAGRTAVFGSTPGIDTLAATGTGLGQGTSVFGRVPPQPTPSPGLYSDTVVATITY